SAMTAKSSKIARKLPYLIVAPATSKEASASPSAEPNANPIKGLIISSTNDDTTLDTAPPKIKPTANPTTPCSRTKSKKPFIQTHLPHNIIQCISQIVVL